MAGGLKKLGTALGITQVTEGGIKNGVKAVAERNAEFNSARAAWRGAVTAAAQASARIEVWLGKARRVLALNFGEAWSAQWEAAGFTGSSTAVPRTVDGRFKLIGQIEAFLTDNPEYEVVDAKINVTAVEAARLATLSTEADDAVPPLDAAASGKKDARDAAIEDLRGELRLLIDILDKKLGPDDARWAEFGLNRPAADTNPAAPSDLRATVVEGPAILCECEAAPNATRYRWRTRLAGAREYSLAASTTEPMVQLDNVQPGQTVEIVVQAVNGSAQGVQSEVVRVAIPAAQAARVMREAAANGAAEHGDSPETNANGRNGRGNGVLPTAGIP